MVAEQHPGTRYLLVRGKSTAFRHALPPFGSISVGRAEKNDVVINEPGIADEHLLIQVDYGIGVKALDKDSEVDARGRVSGLPVGKTVDVTLEDRVRIGSVEIGFAPHEASKRKHRIWAPAYFEERLREEMQRGEGTLTVVRFAIEELSEDAIESILYEHVDPKQLVTELGPGDYAVLALGLAEEEAQSLATQIAKQLAAQGAEVAFGTAVAADGDASSLLATAERRIKRASNVVGARVVMESEEMQRIAGMVDQVAKTSSHVLILGETGTGKDVIAQMIHDRSERAGRPFVRVNCVDLGEGSIEEHRDDDGQPLLARAQGGTLLLDEVGGLSQRAQLSLGHLLEKWAAQSRSSRRQAVRVIATSNQDLEASVEEGQFRKDLFFRLNRVTFQVPPLRDRREDIAALARSFVDRGEGARHIDDSVMHALESYDWPGNVRELRNVVERASMMARGDRITLHELPETIRGDGTLPPPPPSTSSTATPRPPATTSDGQSMTLREEMAELEKRRILEALDKYPTQTDAAKALDIPLRTFLNRLDALGIPRARKAKKP
jgi:two-component system, NtrC family, response regulator AtoC